MNLMARLQCALLLFSASAPAFAEATRSDAGPSGVPIGVDLGLTFSRFEQQVKPEIGGQRGARLVEHTELGVLAMGLYSPFEALGFGVYAQSDFGFRSAGRFSDFDASGAAQITHETGGGYQELWVGPLVRGSYGPAFVEVGWGAIGLRWDDSRDDLPSQDGGTHEPFSRSPAVAWLIAAGGVVPLDGRFDLVLRLEYRVRYYQSRGGEPLADGVAHGTQNFTPFFGARYSFGRSRS